MKYIFTTLTVILLFSGCSKQNAFSKFNMSKEQELSASSIQSSKVRFNEKINGTFSSIYLNEIYPEKYFKNEYFFIYYYLKEKAEIYNPKSFVDTKLTLKLNSKLPISMEKLSNKNQFSHLVWVDSEWNQYYIATFEKQDVKKLNLVLENPPYSSAALVYQKGE